MKIDQASAGATYLNASHLPGPALDLNQTRGKRPPRKPTSPSSQCSPKDYGSRLWSLRFKIDGLGNAANTDVVTLHKRARAHRKELNQLISQLRSSRCDTLLAQANDLSDLLEFYEAELRKAVGRIV